MKPYRVEVEVTTKWILEVHAEDEHDAAQTASNMVPVEIEAMGDYGEVTNVEVGDIELAYEGYDDES